MKHVKKLIDNSSYRYENLQYVAEGTRWISDALQTHASDFVELFVREDSIEQHIQIINSFKKNVGNKVTIAKNSVFNTASDTKNSQGILAILKMPSNAKGLNLTKHNKVILLDSIKDPTNAGTIVRTALAADFNTVIFDSCIDQYNPKVVRGTMGAMLHVNYIVASLKTNFTDFKNSGYTIICAALNGENVFTATQKHDKIVLVVGSEADGIRKDYLPLLDKKLTIPMNQRIESLNASVAAGILMYHLSL